MAEERIYLPSHGSIPGIPGEHAPGEYWLDVEARTIRPLEPAPTRQKKQDKQPPLEASQDHPQA